LEADEPAEITAEHEPEEIVMAVNRQQSSSDQKRRTLRLCGQIGKFPVLILVDSGSVGTFISSELATRLPHVLTECPPTQFMTADGTPMTLWAEGARYGLDVSRAYICVGCWSASSQVL
jgi:hypothetical protein